jgi:hypothetical protein
MYMKLTEKEIASTVSAMHSMVDQERMFNWGLSEWALPDTESEIIALPEAMVAAYGETHIHRTHFAIIHDAWVEQSKEQIYINKLLTLVAEYEVRMKDGRERWPSGVLEDFAKFIRAA